MAVCLTVKVVVGADAAQLAPRIVSPKGPRPVTKFHMPAQLQPEILAQQEAARADTDQRAERWRSWATALNTLAETMPPLPATVRIRNHLGVMTAVEPGTTSDYRKDMRKALRQARDHADAYAATIARTFQRVEMDATVALSELVLWGGQRYFPASHVDGESTWHVVIDTAEDRTGFWEYTSDPARGADCFEDYDEAAAAARQLNADPQPFPPDAPRGRYIPWRGEYVDYEVIDRGDNLDQWVRVEVVDSMAEAAELAKAFATGKQRPLDPVAGNQPW